MGKYLRAWIIKQLLKDFEVEQQRLSDGEFSAAMNDVYQSDAIKKYFNILWIKLHTTVTNLHADAIGFICPMN